MGIATSDVPLTRERFLEALNGSAHGSGPSEELTQKLRQALLDFGSETPVNLNCAHRVEVGHIGVEIGPKVTGQDALFSDTAHALEAEAMHTYPLVSCLPARRRPRKFTTSVMRCNNFRGVDQRFGVYGKHMLSDRLCLRTSVDGPP